MRARNIKPGFFKNEDLAEIEPLGRILFAGLWCMADREGRLEDRPKRIKVEILPYDSCNINRLLEVLAAAKFVTRYSVNGCKYIQILNFLKHQSPHIKEQESTIPAPDLHQTCTVQTPDLHGSCPPDSLIPDSSTDSDPCAATENPLPQTQPEIYACQFFSINTEYFSELKLDWPGLTDSQLKSEFKKMRDWCIDNAKKKRKLKANGQLSNARLFIRNWLDKVEINPPDNGNGHNKRIIVCLNHPERKAVYLNYFGQNLCQECKDISENLRNKNKNYVPARTGVGYG